ncbi:ABC transporter substrate-binding protein [Erythrobacter sp. WH131]|uniref:ABC transporter substrate-binding protein n=2 Tax=Erythrobacter ani TaxID=2827235 RepID=A0ABS6SNZ8_9SPHN|nr:ABC transporter substrate-binding protein [Erythrobacter ani]
MPLKLSAFLAGSFRWLAASAATLALAACSAPATRETETSRLPTIVSLNPCLDAILVEVADPRQVLALSHYSRDPASSSLPPAVAARYRFTGGTAEEVLALEPDIVLASTFIAPTTRSAFERLGLRVETFGSPASVEDSYAQIERLADLTNGSADDLIARIDTAIGELAEMRAVYGDVDALLWQSGQIVAGENALVTTVLEHAGFSRSEDATRLGQGDYVSLERLLADPPDMVLVAGQSAGQLHPALDTLENTQIAPLDPTLFYCGGPSLIALAERLGQLRTSVSGEAP